MSELTTKWKKLFHINNCGDWDPRHVQRYLNIPNDPEEIDEEEYESAKELIAEINGKCIEPE